MFAEMLDSNYALLTSQDVVKFVIAGTQDLETALAQIQNYELPSKCEVFLVLFLVASILRILFPLCRLMNFRP